MTGQNNDRNVSCAGLSAQTSSRGIIPRISSPADVRDYAIFLMDPDGVIRCWGEGARLMKWWMTAPKTAFLAELRARSW